MSPDTLHPIVLAVSKPGRVLAMRIAEALAGECASRDRLAEAYRAGQPVVGVGALGIWVRLLAPLLGDKLADPPVVVVDDAGRFAVALTGGHHGGNALADRIATLLGATAVVTTATDVLGLPSVETLAERYGWSIEASRDARLHVNAALVDGHPVLVYQDAGPGGWLTTLPPHATIAPSPPSSSNSIEGATAIFVTDRALPEIAAWGERAAVLRPPTLVAGIGSSRGVEADEVLALLHGALEDTGLAAGSLALVATAEVKRDEPGIVEAAGRLDLPMLCFDASALAAVEVPTPSAEVARHVQTPSVAEAAALLASGAAELLVEKRKSAHATVAIARLAPVDPAEAR